MIELLYGKFADTTTGHTVFAYQCKVCAMWSSMSTPHMPDCPVPAVESERERLINLSVALERELTAMEGSNNALMKVVIAAYDLGYQVEDGPNTEDFWKVYREALSLEVRKSIVDLKS